MRNVTVEEAAALLRGQDQILILTHRSPDGDTLGSGFALLRALLSCGKRARLLCSDPIPAKYEYLRRGLSDADFAPAFVVAVDIADEKLLGAPLEAQYAGRIDLCVDHHLSNTGYAKALLLRECAATCELIEPLVRALGCRVTPAIADCIYTGLSTDTGCFRYSNVTPETFELAAEMLRAGADFDNINRVMFETKTKTYLKLEALVLASLELHFGGRCAAVTITQEMFRILRGLGVNNAIVAFSNADRRNYQKYRYQFLFHFFRSVYAAPFGALFLYYKRLYHIILRLSTKFLLFRGRIPTFRKPARRRSP